MMDESPTEMHSVSIKLGDEDLMECDVLPLGEWLPSISNESSLFIFKGQVA
jgi:hypothetical protein